MARDTFAVPATGSGVEREFSISGNIVNARRNRLSPKTISDLMQFKRWKTRTGKVAEFLQNQQNLQVLQDELEDFETDHEPTVESEDDEINTDLITWLAQWQTREDLRVCGKFLEPTA
jgi:hAT family C-terminal dimerisation region